MKLLLSLVLPWALSHIDEVIEALAKHAGVDAQIAGMLADIAGAVVEGSRAIAEARPDMSTEEGAELVAVEISRALDEADELPMWADWTEAERDDYISALSVLVLGTLRMARAGNKPKRAIKREIKRVVMPRILKGLKL